MCGICGIAGEGDITRASLQVMNDRLRHRGPDDEGYFIGEKVGLAMRRLAIIDVEGGQQPISNEDDSIWLVFNGEIYNYRELIPVLEGKGHRFKTASDTECIIHAYEEYGLDCVHHFNGMFAFALWDNRQNRLWIARDRLGQKPLYYHWDGRRLIFASELTALLPHLDQPTLNEEAIHHYLSFQYIPQPLSILKNVHKLPPAHHLIWSAEGLRTEKYWRLSFAPQERPLDQLKEELRAHVKRAVNLRMRSDVPLGAFLSSGMDSAIIVASMAQPVQAFTVSFGDKTFDESEAAARLAAFVGANHTVERVDVAAERDLNTLINALDEPFADSSCVATYAISKVARRAVTVALSGDGGDEIFGGYQRYSLDKLARLYRFVPPLIRNGVVDRFAQRLSVQRDLPIEANYALGLRRLRQVMSIPQSASILRWGSYFTEAMKAQLYQNGFAENLRPSWEILAETFAASDAKTLLGRTMHSDTLSYLADNGMVKVDRMSMANSLELRSPFLDYQLAEFMATVPDRYKVRGLSRKWLLKESFRDLLPPNWEKQPKRGFEVPVSRWLREDLHPMAGDLLLSPNAHTRSFFQPTFIAGLLTDHYNQRDDHGRRLWALLVLEKWIDAHLAH